MLNLREFVTGGGRVTATPPAYHLTLPPLGPRQYGDAQLDDYQKLRRWQFPQRPPVRLSLRARASHAQPVGTLGFGFWNNPFSLTGGMVLTAPSVVWFFYASPPSDMALVEGVPGWGWKAATLDAGRWPAWLLAPGVLGAILFTKIPGLGRPILNLARRMVRAHEAALPDVALAEWHHYAIDWQTEQAIFWVDGVMRLQAPMPPTGPLGLVLWIDNQYAIVSRAGRFAFGVCPTAQAQWLELAEVTITRGPGERG